MADVHAITAPVHHTLHMSITEDICTLLCPTFGYSRDRILNDYAKHGDMLHNASEGRVAPHADIRH